MNKVWPTFTLPWFWSSLLGDTLGTTSPSGMAGMSSDMRCCNNTLLTSHGWKHILALTELFVGCSRTARRVFWATLTALLSWWLVFTLRSLDVHGSEGLVFIFTAVSLLHAPPRRSIFLT